ncbi:16S rRNA (guanine(527)-N(7))-methyltransferase RsmG [Yoonia sp. BS5-3]|uniref:Ribosomal RNA small subunit methyltransferase G n=1 Tax=Yoonia phaeophyticola TaxID=3137369 RepID=A0ABZ2V6V7_9RHOB
MPNEVAGEDVSRETFDDLIKFSDLVRKWTTKINLIAPSTIDDIWSRHVVDSSQLFRYAPNQFNHWVDIGSGGGFPGIVMAIYAKEQQPAAKFTLIESDQRKATFLRTASRELSLNVSVVAARIEDVPYGAADIVSARALATLSTLLPLANQHLAPDGTCLFHKGKRVDEEIEEARKNWLFDLEEHPSFTDPAARLLVIQRISRAE